MIIAIDGPAGSGKSSTAREIARRRGFLYIDTGAMYRAVALYALQEKLDPESPKFDETLLRANVALERVDSAQRVYLNGQDVTSRLRSIEVSEMSSRVSKKAIVRKRLVQLQRKLAERAHAAGQSVVMEGRDIGTVVFPDAEHKFFLIADTDVRTQRRLAQMKEEGQHANEAEIRADIVRRDERDASRDVSPLKQADDAIEIDTSETTFEEQVDNILARISGNVNNKNV